MQLSVKGKPLDVGDATRTHIRGFLADMNSDMSSLNAAHTVKKLNLAHRRAHGLGGRIDPNANRGT